MKHLKQYEDLNNKPQIGDYVIVKHLKNLEIAQIDSIINGNYIIVFNDNTGRTYHYEENEMLHWSNNIEDLEAILIANNYNL